MGESGSLRKEAEWEELVPEEEAASRQLGDSGISEVKVRKREGQKPPMTAACPQGKSNII